MKISDIYEELLPREILTSRGTPTVEVDLHTIIGVFRSSVPEGASTGKEEAIVILDGSDRYNGKGVKRAIFNIKSVISPKLQHSNINVFDQILIDKMLNELDGTENKKRLGCNAILPVSMALCRAGAVAKNLSLREHIERLMSKQTKTKINFDLPRPFFNVINGGEHASNKLKFQEVMISFDGNEFSEILERACVFYYALKKKIQEKYENSNVGDEGGFAPEVETLEEALNLILEVYEDVNFEEKLEIAIDCAANSFFKDGKYEIEENKFLSSDELLDFYSELIQKYPIVSIEDPFSEGDLSAWKKFTEKNGSKVRIVGDDLTVTNEKKIDSSLCNSLLVKLNQIGTVSEAIAAARKARELGMKLMVSHRSAETEDTFVCDFCVGIKAEYFKAGAPCRGERTAKYNQLLRIEEALKRESEE